MTRKRCSSRGEDKFRCVLQVDPTSGGRDPCRTVGTNGRILFYGGLAYGCTSTEKPPSLLHPSFRLNFTLYLLSAQENNWARSFECGRPSTHGDSFLSSSPATRRQRSPLHSYSLQIDETSSCTTLCPGKYFEDVSAHCGSSISASWTTSTRNQRSPARLYNPPVS